MANEFGIIDGFDILNAETRAALMSAPDLHAVAALMLTPERIAQIRDADKYAFDPANEIYTPEGERNLLVHHLTLSFTCHIREQKDWAALELPEFQKLALFHAVITRHYPFVHVSEGWGSSWDFRAIDCEDFIATIAGYSLETDEAYIDLDDENFDVAGLKALEAYLHRNIKFGAPGASDEEALMRRAHGLYVSLPHMEQFEDDAADEAKTQRIAEYLKS